MPLIALSRGLFARLHGCDIVAENEEIAVLLTYSQYIINPSSRGPFLFESKKNGENDIGRWRVLKSKIEYANQRR